MANDAAPTVLVLTPPPHTPTQPPTHPPPLSDSSVVATHRKEWPRTIKVRGEEQSVCGIPLQIYAKWQLSVDVKHHIYLFIHNHIHDKTAASLLESGE